jgi:excisionase family DNA binding protein
MAPSRGPFTRLHDIEEAAALLSVRKSWLQVKVTQRAVPFTRLGRHVRFSDEHLHQIAAAGEMVPLMTTKQPRRGRAL